MTEPQNPASEETRHAMPAKLLHDLRTELGPIIGYAELLMELAHEQGQECFLPDLQNIQTAAKNMAAFISANFRGIGLPETPAESATQQAAASGTS